MRENSVSNPRDNPRDHRFKVHARRPASLPLQTDTGDHVRRLFVFCLTLYIALYAFEGLARYGLFLLHIDGAILARDLLIDVPLLVLLIAQIMRAKLDPAYVVFGFLMTVHGLMGYLNLHTITPVLYGAKLLVNVLFGMVAAPLLITPGRSVTRVFAAIWVISVGALVVDKLGVAFPWTGLQTNIGGINVDVSHDWQITDLIDRRVAGLSRSSISAATLVPMLAMILCFRTRLPVVRAVILLATYGVVFLTTQKGALLALLLAGGCIMVPGKLKLPALRTAAVFAAVVVIAAPILMQGLLIQHADGVFSTSSFAMRAGDTWPRAMKWIAWNDNFPFGVGLGGIGGAQRLYAPDFYNPADNLFVLLYAFFGLFGVAYLVLLPLLALRSRVSQAVAEPAVALLVFMLGYGVVLSMIEDQMAALSFGIVIGALWQRRNIFDWSYVPRVRKPLPRIEPIIGNGSLAGQRS
jgi:hypothetical protein